MRITALLCGALLVGVLFSGAALAADEQAWPPEMEAAYQDFIHPQGARATDVLYFVPGKEAAADYYSNLFGFPMLWNEPGGPAFLMVDDHVSLSLLDVHEFGPPGWTDGDPLPPAMLGFQVDDSDAEVNKLKAGGCEIMPVHETDYVKVYVAIDPMYHHSFMFLQMKDSPTTRGMFEQMAAGMAGGGMGDEH